MVTFITVCVCLFDLFFQTAAMYRLVGIWRAFGTVARLRLISSAFSTLFNIQKSLHFFLAIHGLQLGHCVKQIFSVNLLVSLKLSVCIWEECELLCAPG